MSQNSSDFEIAMARAEEIATSIEQGQIGLEESIKQFEEGMALIRKCRQVLSEAELRIAKLEAAGPDSATISGDMKVVDEP